MSIDTSIAELERLFNLQRMAVTDSPYPSLQQRLDWLGRLEQMMLANRAVFAQALQADFGSHPAIVTDLYETAGVVGRARYFQRKLEVWMQPEDISLNPKVHGSSSAEVMFLPMGVVGNIAPWNFPIECALVMVADMLAAGNRVILKPAPLAPATAEVISEAVMEHFPEDVLVVVSGGDALAERFPHLPWDHLTYTGSPRVARIILGAAAENLVPVTLELGGKNPTVFLDDAIEDDLIRSFLEARIMKGGQVCTSPDYVLVPHSRRDDWITRAKQLWSEIYPRYIGHADATSAISDVHYNRVLGYVEEARSRGVEVISLNGDEPDPSTRQIPMYVIVEPPSDLRCMDEEIFGPVTPVCSFKTRDEVIARINAGPSPLASYLVTHDKEFADRFLHEVRSGGAAINNFGTQAGHPAIPFGGIGTSGTGCHSGHDGFLNYSHRKGIFRDGGDSMVTQAMRLPYGPSAQGLVDAILK